MHSTKQARVLIVAGLCALRDFGADQCRKPISDYESPALTVELQARKSIVAYDYGTK